MAHGEVAGQIALEGDELLVRKERGLWSDAWRRLFKNKAATVALFILTAIVVVTLAVNLIPGLLPTARPTRTMTRYSRTQTATTGLAQTISAATSLPA